MTYFYLLLAVFLQIGKPATTPAVPYASERECEEAGVAFADAAVKDPGIKNAAWLCMPINFDHADPQPEPLAPMREAR